MNNRPLPTTTLGLLLGALALTGCGLRTEARCRTGDWHKIGAEDGRKGKPRSALAEHEKDCAIYRVRPDRRAWEWGHRAGLATYCTDANAWELGSHGVIYEGACADGPGETSSFLLAYREGLTTRVASIVDEMNDMNRRSGGLMSQYEADSLVRRSLMLRFDLHRARLLLLQTDEKLGRVAGATPTGGDPSLTHLFADDPELGRAAETIAARGDAATRRAASMRLVAAAQTLTSAKWREERRARAKLGDPQLTKERDERLLIVLAAMNALGGASAVAYCLDLAENESAPLPLRRAALAVVARHVDARDAAARARGFALWERLNPAAPP